MYQSSLKYIEGFDVSFMMDETEISCSTLWLKRVHLWCAGNKDRHHLEVFSEYGNDSSPALFDNGKGLEVFLSCLHSLPFMHAIL